MLTVTTCASLVISLCVCVTTTVSAGQVLYVDAAAVGAGDGSSWADAYVSLQDALGAASAAPKPIEIRVAQGVYKPQEGPDAGPVHDAAFQLLDDVVLRGGYAGAAAADPDVRDLERHPSILSGPHDDLPPTRGLLHDIVTGGNTNVTAVLDGFTVRAGRAGVEFGTGNLAVANCTFENNQIGISYGPGPSLKVSDCRFIDNEDYGIRAGGGHTTVTRCLFDRNGQAIQCFVDGTLAVTDSAFRENNDCAIRSWGRTDLLRCSFISNRGSWRGGRGAIIYCSDSLTARQCSFRSNTVSSHAALLVARTDAEVALVDCDFSYNIAPQAIVSMSPVRGDVVTVRRCSFVGNRSQDGRAGILESASAVTQLSNCLFAGNSCGPKGHGVVFGSGVALRVSNCTFAGNRGQPGAVGGSWCDIALTQCVLTDGLEPVGSNMALCSADVTVTYCSVPGGYPGEGNIDVGPTFVRPGYWADPNDPGIEVGPDDPQAIWVAGDYHLKSQAGHWDSEAKTWVFDDVTSPCIDAGDPNGFLGSEPFPNGGYVNLGAYGGTLEASRSYFGGPVCENQLAGDINGDCIVDQTDLDILLSHWLADATERVNIPPTISLTSPEEGDEFTYPEPIVLRADAADPDGRIVWVQYNMRAHRAGATITTGTFGRDPTKGWETEMTWAPLGQGQYLVWATATDNDGATSTSPTITITLHP